MPEKSIIEIACEVVPERIWKTARLVSSPTRVPPGGGAKKRVMRMAGRAGVTRPDALSTEEIGRRVMSLLGMKPRKSPGLAAPAGQRTPVSAGSGDVVFRDKTPAGVASVVVQVRSGKVKQVIKLAGPTTRRPKIRAHECKPAAAATVTLSEAPTGPISGTHLRNRKRRIKGMTDEASRLSVTGIVDYRRANVGVEPKRL
jgi:hypothetical protein